MNKRKRSIVTPNTHTKLFFFCDAIPILSPYLQEDSLLMLRHVCKRLRDAISKNNNVWSCRYLLPLMSKRAVKKAKPRIKQEKAHTMITFESMERYVNDATKSLGRYSFDWELVEDQVYTEDKYAWNDELIYPNREYSHFLNVIIARSIGRLRNHINNNICPVLDGPPGKIQSWRDLHIFLKQLKAVVGGCIWDNAILNQEMIAARKRLEEASSHFMKIKNEMKFATTWYSIQCPIPHKKQKRG